MNKNDKSKSTHIVHFIICSGYNAHERDKTVNVISNTNFRKTKWIFPSKNLKCLSDYKLFSIHMLEIIDFSPYVRI